MNNYNNILKALVENMDNMNRQRFQQRDGNYKKESDEKAGYKTF